MIQNPGQLKAAYSAWERHQQELAKRVSSGLFGDKYRNDLTGCYEKKECGKRHAHNTHTAQHRTAQHHSTTQHSTAEQRRSRQSRAEHGRAEQSTAPQNGLGTCADISRLLFKTLGEGRTPNNRAVQLGIFWQIGHFPKYSAKPKPTPGT